jgi:hypothetical protein
MFHVGIIGNRMQTVARSTMASFSETRHVVVVPNTICSLWEKLITPRERRPAINPLDLVTKTRIGNNNYCCTVIFHYLDDDNCAFRSFSHPCPGLAEHVGKKNGSADRLLIVLRRKPACSKPQTVRYWLRPTTVLSSYRLHRRRICSRNVNFFHQKDNGFMWYVCYPPR